MATCVFLTFLKSRVRMRVYGHFDNHSQTLYFVDFVDKVARWASLLCLRVALPPTRHQGATGITISDEKEKLCTKKDTLEIPRVPKGFVLSRRAGYLVLKVSAELKSESFCARSEVLAAVSTSVRENFSEEIASRFVSPMKLVSSSVNHKALELRELLEP